MTTIASIVQRMIALLPGDDAIGEYAAVTALATGSVTAGSLAFGGNTEAKYAQKWIWRPDVTSADADRIKECDSWVPSTGQFVHSGSDYTDLTITGENVYLLDFNPRHIRRAINDVVQRIHRRYEVEVIGIQGVNRFWVGDLTWIKEPGDVIGLEENNSPVLTRNRYLRDYNTINSSGDHEPDFWTVANGAAGTGRSTTQTWRNNKYSFALVRSTTDATVTQAIPLLESGVTGDSLRGETISAAIWGWCATGSSLEVEILEDGAVVASSSYHGGASNWEELTATWTVSSTAKSLSVRANMDADATAYIGELYACRGSIDDNVRRDYYPGTPLGKHLYEWEQGGTLALKSGGKGKGGQYILATKRGYPAFDNARLVSGAVDTDETDAPEVAVACGTLWRLYEARSAGDTKSADWVRAAKWQKRFEDEASQHMYVSTQSQGGFNMLGSPLAAGARRMP